MHTSNLASDHSPQLISIPILKTLCTYVVRTYCSLVDYSNIQHQTHRAFSRLLVRLVPRQDQRDLQTTAESLVEENPRLEGRHEGEPREEHDG